MKTILRQVESIENEVAERVAQAEKESQAATTEIIAREPQVIEKIRLAAQARGVEVIREAKQKAKQEAGVLIEDEKKTLVAVTSAADKNRKRAVKTVLELVESIANNKR